MESGVANHKQVLSAWLIAYPSIHTAVFRETAACLLLGGEGHALLLLPRHLPDQLYALLQRLVFNTTLADTPRSAHGSSITCSVEGPCAGGQLPLELWLCTVATPLGSARRACVCVGCIAAACSTSSGPGSQRRRGVERSNCNCRSTSFGEQRPRMPRTNDEAAA